MEPEEYEEGVFSFAPEKDLKQNPEDGFLHVLKQAAWVAQGFSDIGKQEVEVFAGTSDFEEIKSNKEASGILEVVPGTNLIPFHPYYSIEHGLGFVFCEDDTTFKHFIPLDGLYDIIGTSINPNICKYANDDGFSLFDYGVELQGAIKDRVLLAQKVNEVFIAGKQVKDKKLATEKANEYKGFYANKEGVGIYS